MRRGELRAAIDPLFSPSVPTTGVRQADEEEIDADPLRDLKLPMLTALSRAPPRLRRGILLSGVTW
jgi:hypothetical protein